MTIQRRAEHWRNAGWKKCLRGANRRESSTQHVTPTIKVVEQAHTGGRLSFESGTKFVTAVLASAFVLPFKDCPPAVIS